MPVSETNDGLFRLLCAVNALGLSPARSESEVELHSGLHSASTLASNVEWTKPGGERRMVFKVDVGSGIDVNGNGLGGSGSGSEGRGSNNVVDAGQLLRRLQEQLAERRERESRRGALSAARAPSEGWRRGLGQRQLEEGGVAGMADNGLRSFVASSSDALGKANIGVSIGGVGGSSNVVQVLCQRLLAVKFERVMAFALSVHAMRSAYRGLQPTQGSLRSGAGSGAHGAASAAVVEPSNRRMVL